MEQNMVLKLMRVREGAIIPKQATAGSAGYDLCACMDAPQTIEPGERCVFPSGLAAEIPAGTAGFVFTRSGLGIKKGIHVTNGVGVIAITAAKSRSACTISARSRTRCNRASALRK